MKKINILTCNLSIFTILLGVFTKKGYILEDTESPKELFISKGNVICLENNKITIKNDYLLNPGEYVTDKTYFNDSFEEEVLEYINESQTNTLNKYIGFTYSKNMFPDISEL
jgi:hypothetical protein